ncbi:hypothetical protein [Methyloceanibacter superfactus]|uniref:hypothetical protein n=1 Tax=Methyloceanibacter superfactus TaxID=1774969 RepID=UPI001FCD215B|nr:hypothetical protein [Methyloceanibacter superfactus]
MSATRDAIKTLVLALRYPHRASYYDDWADAFSAAPFFQTTSLNVLDLSPSRLARELDEHDLVVLLHNCTADTTEDLERLTPALSARARARLVAFVGNEYNSPYAPMARKIAALETCHADIVATQLLPEAGEYLYGGTCANVISLPHALNPKVFRPGPEQGRRAVDIGVRSYRYSPLLGDKERNDIIDYFRLHGPEHGLSVDVNTTSRFGARTGPRFSPTPAARSRARRAVGISTATMPLSRASTTLSGLSGPVSSSARVRACAAWCAACRYRSNRRSVLPCAAAPSNSPGSRTKASTSTISMDASSRTRRAAPPTPRRCRPVTSTPSAPRPARS